MILFVANIIVMARINIEFPAQSTFTATIPVRITDINYGGHLGNDKVLSLMHEVRMLMLAHYGFTELNIDGAGLIMADAAINFKSEAFFNEQLKSEIAVKDFTRVGFDLYYRFSSGDRVVALGKTGMLFFDYENRKLLSCPKVFLDKFSV